LDNGSVLYVPQSDNIEVRLKLMHGNAMPSESVIYFINPERRVTAPVTAQLARVPVVPVQKAETARPPAPDPIPQAPRKERVQRDTEQPASADQKKPAKAFHLPATRAVIASDRRGSISLPDLPDIRPNQPSAPVLPLANASSIASLLASPTHLAAPPQVRAGRLIWTGALRKNAVLSFSPAGASAGVLNGRLPGVPVKISVQPAELVDGGIAIYSKDRERSGTTELPSAWNGWNVVVYDWDPKRIAEVNVVEAPGAANNWKRMVLRNGNRNVSVLVVDWQRVPGQ
jgi:hypothetical protein